MRTNKFNILLATMIVTICSWKKAGDRLPNINTYHLHIGKKLIFSTTIKNNRLGDTVFVSKKN